MRQQAMPLIIKRKPSRKPNSDADKPSIWGGLDADIARGLRNQQVKDHAAPLVTTIRERALSRCSILLRRRLRRMLVYCERREPEAGQHGGEWGNRNASAFWGYRSSLTPGW